MRKSLSDIGSMKARGEKITMLTAYDASMSRLLAGCDVDMLLVGDSLGMVMLGYDSTVPVTMDEMLHHAKAVRRGAPESFIVGDMPYGSYQTGNRDAINNAIRFLKEADCDAVKLEGGLSMCGIVRALVDAGIPVMAHIGLTPQTASQLGGYKVQGKGIEDATRLVAEAKGLEEAGAFGIILECVPDTLAKVISGTVSMPTVGIGAGVYCDGQVLVTHDLLGMFDKFTPKFVKKFADLSPIIKEAIRSYGVEVKEGSYPAAEHTFTSETNYDSLLEDEKIK
ncbi:MAG: 3-methyl-2-oxobutanoate hydroxymethyltransferase [Desulforhopalus sp.]|jgi:3-methyl-2-oxobutanoate hydroxymethyltransferase